MDAVANGPLPASASCCPSLGKGAISSWARGPELQPSPAGLHLLGYREAEGLGLLSQICFVFLDFFMGEGNLTKWYIESNCPVSSCGHHLLSDEAWTREVSVVENRVPSELFLSAIRNSIWLSLECKFKHKGGALLSWGLTTRHGGLRAGATVGQSRPNLTTTEGSSTS